MYSFLDLKFLSIVDIEFVNNSRYNKEHRSQEFLKQGHSISGEAGQTGTEGGV